MVVMVLTTVVVVVGEEQGAQGKAQHKRDGYRRCVCLCTCCVSSPSRNSTCLKLLSRVPSE
jgi:hypothetical protein